MRLLLVFITLLYAGQPENQEAEIYGHWKLIKIEIENEVLTPESIDYFLTITTEKLSYNLDLNKCQVLNFSIIDNQIKFDYPTCTKACCDGRNDSIANFINYRGIYDIQQNQLIITTPESKLFLNRIIN